MDPLKLVVFFAASLFLGGAGALVIVALGAKIGFVDKPNERSSHSFPTPKGGGVGILVAFFVIGLAVNLPLLLWLTPIILGAFSFAGDRLEISPKVRLGVQFIGAAAVLASVRESNLYTVPSLMEFVFAAIFVVGTANFYNFMDGINGIAAITGIIGYGLLGLYMQIATPSADLEGLMIGISVACLGFLPFNFPNARVFMGDVGSIFLGFVFGYMVIRLSEDLFEFICLASFLFPFYADEATTMVVRLWRRENLLKPHRMHIYQLLANEMGVAHWKVSLSYGVFQLLVGLGVLLTMPRGVVPVLTVLILSFFSFTLFGLAVRKKAEKTCSANSN